MKKTGSVFLAILPRSGLFSVPAIVCMLAGLAIPALSSAASDHSPHQPASPSPVQADAGDVPAEATTAVAAFPPPTPEQLQAAFPDLGGMSMSSHMAAGYYGTVMINRLEVEDADAHAALVWDAKASWGREFDKINVGSEGGHAGGEFEHLRTEIFWSHSVSRWWDTTLGMRQDNCAGPSRDWAALGVQGLAPYFFELNATAYAGNSGRSALRLNAEYDMRFTDRLILQPRLELNAYGKTDAETGTGKGLSDSAAGLRLRYEICREVAPYLGIEWSRQYGEAADQARAAGERTGEARAVAGIRLWY